MVDQAHLADILSRATPAAAELIKNLGPDQKQLMDDDRLLNSEPDWSLPEVMDYTNPREW